MSILRLTFHKVGNRSPILRLTFHKVGNRSPNGCVGDSRQRIYVILDIGIGGFCA
ncbi:MAG: hypothetical protein LBU34_11440 [Planctomycetaceae bacterium]|nr:hypothetical protein [Planctomycetaceae bacterium]